MLFSWIAPDLAHDSCLSILTAGTFLQLLENWCNYNFIILHCLSTPMLQRKIWYEIVDKPTYVTDDIATFLKKPAYKERFYIGEKLCNLRLPLFK